MKRGALTGNCLAAVADGATDGGQGVLLACAEGVAGRPEPEHAARSATTALGDAYYSAVDTGSPVDILREGITAANHAVRATGERGRAATMAALIIEGRHWYCAHAGQVRVWRYRDLQIKQLTRDHLIPRAPRQSEVTKACGFADTLDAEYGEGELREGDIFLVTSPGVHDVLSGAALLGVLQSDATAQQMADALVQQAITQHAPAYAGTCVAKVEKLPRESTRSHSSLAPLTEPPALGAKLDGFVIEKLLLKSRRFWLYRALDSKTSEDVILRFPDVSHGVSASSFLREESISRRIDSPHILKPVALRPGRRTALYSVIEYRKTESVAKRIRRKSCLPPDEALRLGDQLLATLETLHRQGVIHGDVRPHNLLYDRDKRQLYVFGMMAPATDTDEENGVGVRSGTLSYRAPELFGKNRPTERSDIYSAGVTIYRMLTEEYPYGKIRPTTDRGQLIYTSMVQYQEQLPLALDDVIARACAINPADRYQSVAQFAAALSSVQITASITKPGTTLKAPSPVDTETRWAWGLAIGVTAALLAYLYFALR